MGKIKNLIQNEKKRNEFKKIKNKNIIKSPEPRATRKMFKNKNKKVIIVKHATNPISITPLKKKKKWI